MRAAILLCLLAAPALAQTPNALVQFPEPPELNGAPATTYNRHLLWNSGKTCVQRPVGPIWECFATQAEVASTYLPTATANSTFATLQSSITGNTTDITGLTTRVTTLESQITTVQSAASAAQTSATSAASAAATAQTAATAAQSAASTNATAIAALAVRMTAAETAIVALQALPAMKCENLSVASSITLPLGGLSSTSTVTVTGAPVGTYCGVGTPSFLPLGAEPLAAVATTSTVSVRFQGSVGVIVPAGTYRVCCVL